ncbi:uncharacterized protein LOC116192495 [Punica granatum]|uniref:Uncharacterized protein LOC116192495 n=1 Tax=Punica granatum TaxID=22663 RepID=A0A6P8C5B3_PUNGR|nr:uncharacterized protein LOC116192495 [Punica granatum]
MFFPDLHISSTSVGNKFVLGSPLNQGVQLSASCWNNGCSNCSHPASFSNAGCGVTLDRIQESIAPESKDAAARISWRTLVNTNCSGIGWNESRRGEVATADQYSYSCVKAKLKS